MNNLIITYLRVIIAFLQDVSEMINVRESINEIPHYGSGISYHAVAD